MLLLDDIHILNKLRVLIILGARYSVVVILGADRDFLGGDMRELCPWNDFVPGPLSWDNFSLSQQLNSTVS